MSKETKETAEDKAIKKTDMLKVRLDAIVVQEGFNVREDYGDIDGLAKQIASQGQKQPLKGVRNGERVTLTAGHRRFEAIKLANEKYGANIDYALVITEKVDDKARVFEMLIDGDGSKPLTNPEMIKGISRLLKMGVSRKEIVDSLGMGLSQAQKYNLVSAAEAPQAVQKMIEKGEISVAKVNEIQRSTKDEQEQIKLADEASKQGRKARTKKQSTVELLEEAISLADPTSAKVANLKAIVRKLKSGATAQDIATLLK